MPILIKDDKNVLSAFFGILATFVFIVGFIATIIDPSDKMFKTELKKRKQVEKQNGTYTLEISKNYDFCVICASNINSSSKHCKICNRCVDNFDHHCNWLNNCIGNQNYAYFFSLLIVVLIDLLYDVSVFIYAFVIYIERTSPQEEGMQKVTEKFNVSPTACATISFIMAMIDTIIICNICYLIIIHTWLRCQGMTTYEYIVKKLALEEEGKVAHNQNDQSENIVLKINQRNSQKKGRNKIIPQDLLEKIKKIEKTQTASNKFGLSENKDKIIIKEKDFTSKIFKPIVDDIYFNHMKYRKSDFISENNRSNSKVIQESFDSTPKKIPSLYMSNGNNFVSSNTDFRTHKKTHEIKFPPHYPYPHKVSDENSIPETNLYHHNQSDNNLNPTPSLERMHTIFDGHP